MRCNRILLISQYFHPENFRINDIALGLKEKGYDVTVLTGIPNYPAGKFFPNYSIFGPSKDCFNNMVIYRVPLWPRRSGSGLNLFLNYISFAFFSSLRILRLKNNYDLIFTYQPSPITVAIPSYIAKLKFKIPIIFWCQDLWPHSVVDAGKMDNPKVISILNKFSKWVYRISDRILVQSKGFIDPILKQGGDLKKIKYVPNTIEEHFGVESINLKASSVFTITFAGNIGKAQNLETLVKAINIVKEENIPFLAQILGDGREKQKILDLINELNVSDYFNFVGQIPSSEVPSYYQKSDALFVSLLRKPTFETVIPNKVQSYLASGKPIIGCLSGEGKKVIEESKGGICVEAGEYKNLAEVLISFTKLSSDELMEMGANSKRYFDCNFSRSKILNDLSEIFNEVACQKF